MKLENVVGIKMTDKTVYFYSKNYIVWGNYEGLKLDKLEAINLNKNKDEDQEIDQ